MHYLVVASIVAVLSFDFLIEDIGLLPRLFRFAPEILALCGCVLIITAGVRNRFQHVRAPYWLLFGALAVTIACGAIVNSLPPGPIFAGLRSYLRAMPFFFLPAVVLLSRDQTVSQLRLVAFLCVLQLPIALYQRFQTMAVGATTGDWTYGTLMGPSQLTIFLLPCAAVITAFFLRKKISLAKFLVLIVVAMTPMMLNESKAAFVMTPLVLITVFLAGSEHGTRVKNAVLAVFAVTLFTAIFVSVYNYYQATNNPSRDETLIEFFTTEGRLENYLDRGRSVGDTRTAPGKLGSIRVAFELISKDPVTLAFGVGIANISESALGEDFTGQYFSVYGHLVGGTFSTLMAEIGLLGLGLVLLLYAMIFKDCLYVARRDSGTMGALAIGWTGAIVALFLGMGQTSTMPSAALSVLFWYFSGMIVAHRARLEAPAATRIRARGADADKAPLEPRAVASKPF